MWSGHESTYRRLVDEPIAWLTTVSGEGVPSTAPIWFLLEDDDTITVYSRDPSVRVRNLTENEHITFHLEGDGEGGAIVVLRGTAAIDKTIPPVSSHPRFIAKYQPFLDRFGWTPEGFAKSYPTPIRISIRSIRD
jgi:PPOX class probable F420-dependent enzyme